MLEMNHKSLNLEAALTDHPKVTLAEGANLEEICQALIRCGELIKFYGEVEVSGSPYDHATGEQDNAASQWGQARGEAAFDHINQLVKDLGETWYVQCPSIWPVLSCTELDSGHSYGNCFVGRGWNLS